MRKYELTAVFAGTISDTDIAALLSRVQKIITDAGATDVQALELGKHHLAYDIGQNKFGHFVNFAFEAEPAMVQVMQAKLRLTKEVVRFTLQHYVAARFKRQPQIADTPLIKASRENREDRGEREDRPSHGFAGGHTPEPEKPAVSLEEIDKKLDQLEGDLAPSV